MGQRHQLFVIARLKGKYRSLAALHHQWLYGHTALSRCRDILQIFSNPSNRIPLAQELKDAESRGPEFWEYSEDETLYAGKDAAPFPFITSCLILGASFNPAAGYFHQVHVEDYRMAYDGGDNNNGITIIDISDLGRPRYCFVDFYGMESEREVQLMAPLSGRVYLEAYYDLTDPDYKSLESCIDGLEPWSMVTTKALEDTWPEEGWNEPDLPNIEILSLSHMNINPSPEDKPQHVRALRDAAFDQVADAIIEDADTSLENVVDAQRMNDFWQKLRARFYETACGKTFDNRSLDLLLRSLEGEVDVDLSRFDSMKSHQVVYLTDRLLEGNSSVKSLNLSGLRLAKEDIMHILRNGKGLTALYMMGESPVQPREIAECKPGFDVYEARLLQQALVDEMRSWPREVVTRDLLDFSYGPQPVVQVTWLGLGEHFLSDRDSYDTTGHLKYGPMVHFREKSESLTFFEQRRRPACCQCPLTDIPLPLARLVGGLKVFLQWFAQAESFTASRCADLHRAIASSFAIGKLDDGMLEPGVGAMSAELYQDYRERPTGKSPLHPGQWATLIIQPVSTTILRMRDARVSETHRVMTEMSKGDIFDPSKLYYALVSPEEGTESYQVVDMPQYLELVGTKEAEELASWWKTRVKSLPYINYLGGSEVQAMAREVFRGASSEESET